jgi:hypothetical protein
VSWPSTTIRTPSRAPSRAPMRTCGDRRYCLVEGLGALDQRPGNASPPWAPGRREEWADVERAAAHGDDIWCMAEVEIFADLTAAEMQAIAAAGRRTTTDRDHPAAPRPGRGRRDRRRVPRCTEGRAGDRRPTRCAGAGPAGPRRRCDRRASVPAGSTTRTRASSHRRLRRGAQPSRDVVGSMPA